MRGWMFQSHQTRVVVVVGYLMPGGGAVGKGGRSSGSAVSDGLVLDSVWILC